MAAEALFLPAKLSQLDFQDVIDGLGADVGAYIIIDVMHEIADIHAKSEREKKLNEEIAVSLNCLIKTLK